MEENGEIINLVSHSTIVALVLFLAILLILLFFLYKYLNKEANGKYTVQRIVFREGGLRDRARDATVTVGNRLGVQLQRRSDANQDQENDEDDEEEQVISNGHRSEEDYAVQIENEKSNSAAELDNLKENSEEHNSDDSLDEEEQQSLLVELEPELKAEAGKTEEPAADEAQEEEPSGAIVINLNQFSGGVLWAEEDADNGGGDVTAL